MRFSWVPLFLFASSISFVSAEACSLNPNSEPALPGITPSMNIKSALNIAWNLKHTTRARLINDHTSGKLDANCSKTYGDFYNKIRLYEDRVSNLGFRQGAHTTVSPYTPNNSQLYSTSTSGMHDLGKDLRSGDIILSRGNAFTSAAIAHLGESDQLFSHASLVYRDEKTNQLYTIEAHIEIGVVARPIQANIDEMNSRAAVFRFQDPQLAHHAAKLMFNRAREHSANGANINYDFAMDMSNGDSLFCSEVISYAFQKASRGQTKVPLFKSRLDRRNIAFEHSIDIFQAESFLPGDLETDPRFELVAEWRDWKKVRDLHEKDAILRSMLSWMDHRHYRLDQSLNADVWLKKNVGYLLRRIPGADKMVEDKFPLNMNRNLIGVFTILDQTGEIIQNRLKGYVNQSLRHSGGVLPTEESMMKFLERYREIDAKSSSSEFHSIFHP